MNPPSAAAVVEPPPSRKLGTFGGVFTPSVLTILGVVMFLRFGQVTGHAGLRNAILIVLVANLVSVLTSLSLAVIATNTRVHGGGDYFLISRSLGLEFGGAIGTVLYLAQSVSVGFYVVGFTEALMEVTSGGLRIPLEVAGFAIPSSLRQLPIQPVISTVTVLLLFCVAFRGADIATRFQYFIMVALGFALFSYFFGAAAVFEPRLMAENVGPAITTGEAANTDPSLTVMAFWAAFAVFFPAITGFTQGVSMSGDLKDPQKSLPKGTFLAVGLSLAVYLVLPFLIAGSEYRENLLKDTGAATMKRSALIPWLVDVGVFAACLSSALASMMGAPRILRAMGMDAIFPGSRWFAIDRSGSGEPRRAMLVTLGIALICIWAGDLNAIAAVVSMFFLLSYGALNYATFVEGFSRNPSFRPRFKFSGWRTSLVGAFVCGGVMLAINPLATVVAAAILWGIHRYLVHRDLEHPSGDARRGFYVQRIKDYLLKLADRPPHPRTWRPVVLAVVDKSDDGPRLARFAYSIGQQQGVLTVAMVLVGEFEALLEERTRQREAMNRFVRDSKMEIFPEVTIADTWARGIRSLLLVHGIGELRPNTLLLTWSEAIGAEYMDILTSASALDYNVVLLHVPTGGPFSLDPSVSVPSEKRRIDVWWRGRQNGTLSLLLAHLIRDAKDWRGCTIRLIRIVREPEEEAAGTQELVSLVENSRIDATVEVVVSEDPPFDVIAENSAGSHLVFLGVGGVGPTSRADLSRYNPVLARLPATVLVFAHKPLDVEV